MPAPTCGMLPIDGPDCAGAFIWRLGAFAPGQTVTVTAWDSQGNEDTEHLTIPQ